MEVAWFDTDGWEEEYFKGRDTGMDIDFYDQPLDSENVEKAEGYDAVSVFVTSRIDEEVVQQLDCNLIACRSTGYDHVAVEKAAEQGIPVCNVPEYGGTTVAEHTFGLVLALSRNIYTAVEKVEEGEFDHEGLRGFDLKGKKLGVVGTGAIGRNVIRIANGFDMHVIAHDPQPDRQAAHEQGFMYVSMEDLLSQSDIVTLHCPLTDETEHMLSEDEFEMMDDTLLINTARGGLVDQEALIEALEDGNVRAAGLDVLEEECYIEDDIRYLDELEEKCDPRVILEDHILMEREDVLVTPHNAFNSREAMQRIAETTLENIRTSSNVVNSPWN
ncbi:MAG: NAD(P)-dependent oxidoreductase [Candidatus Nanohaloarchaea archaeon]